MTIFPQYINYNACTIWLYNKIFIYRSSVKLNNKYNEVVKLLHNFANTSMPLITDKYTAITDSV